MFLKNEWLKIDCKSNVETLTTEVCFSCLTQFFSDIKRIKPVSGFDRETVLFIAKISSSSIILFTLWQEPKYMLNLYYEMEKP